MEEWVVTYKSALVGDLPRIGTVAALYLVFTLFEAGLPAQRGQGLGGRIRNILFGIIFVLGGFAGATTVIVLSPWWPHTRRSGGIETSMLICAGYLLVIDFLYYWYHRAQHHFAWLWPVHELHHADAELNVTTSNRTYWLELPIQFLVTSLPAYFLFGMDTVALFILSLVSASWLLFTHANLRLRLGWLTPIFCGPHLHRIHHSTVPVHLDKNFAQFFPMYDVLLGTYYRPARDEFPPTGTRGLASSAAILDVLVQPFRSWARTLRPSAQATRPARVHHRKGRTHRPRRR